MVQSSFLQRHAQKLIFASLWLIILGSYWGYLTYHNESPMVTAQSLSQFLQKSVYGPIIFLAIFLIRPLILFPTSILTILSGFLFGPFWGVAYALTGDLSSALVAYWVGYYFGQDLFQNRKQAMVNRYADYLQRNSFESVLIMRLLLLNYDFVSYLAGLVHIHWRAFLLATALGSITGIVSYVLAGASIEGQFDGRLPSFDPWMISLSILLFGLSLALAWYLRRWKRTDLQLND
jgi:uncharacterized membrane protein YdjX (TVP38/TMEM64 family)